jgi:hypothetical protein
MIAENFNEGSELVWLYLIAASMEVLASSNLFSISSAWLRMVYALASAGSLF